MFRGHECYVGNYLDCPGAVNQELTKVHPREFQSTVNSLTTHIWTNNPYIVDCFDPDKVICYSKTKQHLPLSSHPDWDKWHDEMSAGEFWSMVGEDWVDAEIAKKISSTSI